MFSHLFVFKANSNLSRRMSVLSNVHSLIAFRSACNDATVEIVCLVSHLFTSVFCRRRSTAFPIMVWRNSSEKAVDGRT